MNSNFEYSFKIHVDRKEGESKAGWVTCCPPYALYKSLLAEIGINKFRIDKDVL